MNKQFEYRIVFVMLLALALVCITGIYAYRQFSHVVLNLGKDVMPDLRLVTTKAVMNGLSDTENSVKSYNLTKDSLYLNQFNAAVDRTNSSLERLRQLTIDDEETGIQLDSIQALVATKTEIMNRWLQLTNPYRANVALRKAALKLEIAAGQEESRTKLSAAEVNRQLQYVKKEEALVESVMREREMKLISANNAIMDQIRERLQVVEKSELERLAQKTQNAEKAVQSINQQMAMFFVVMGLLLLIMAFIILSYVRNNNRYRKALKVAKKEAENHAKSRETFLANMSHEIRTPMNAIAGFTEQLAHGKLNEEQQEQLGMVRKSTNHLLHVINEILDLTKLDSDKLELEKIGFRITDVVKEAVAFVTPMAEEKELQLHVVVSDKIPQILVGDPYRLRQILLNLLSNAIKFTNEGSVSVLASIEENQLRIEVKDTGIGISKAKLERVFEEFEQAETSTTRNYGGTGLGLSIVHRLVNLHQGKIEVQSEPQKGTRVIMEIPYEKGTEDNLPATAVSSAEKNMLQGINVLIVDDEPFNRKLLVAILRRHGAKSVEADNGKLALEQLRLHNFDLVLMDARMPEMNGLETTKAIRKLNEEKKNSVPIIILSAAVTLDDREKYDAATISGFVAKPFNENELLNAIGNALSSLEKMRNNKAERIDAKTITELDFSEMIDLSGNDELFYREMLQIFCDGTAKGIEDIRHALEIADVVQAAGHAHRICAPCKHLSAIKLHSMLKEMEEEGRRNADLQTLKELLSEIEKEAKLVLQQVDKELKK